MTPAELAPGARVVMDGRVYVVLSVRLGIVQRVDLRDEETGRTTWTNAWTLQPAERTT